jgi:hypothetical protein
MTCRTMHGARRPVKLGASRPPCVLSARPPSDITFHTYPRSYRKKPKKKNLRTPTPLEPENSSRAEFGTTTRIPWESWGGGVPLTLEMFHQNIYFGVLGRVVIEKINCPSSKLAVHPCKFQFRSPMRARDGKASSDLETNVHCRARSGIEDRDDSKDKCVPQ